MREAAVRRGKRGYSELVEEALVRYLDNTEPPDSGSEDFQDPFEGVWTEEEAEAIRTRIKEHRASWH